VTTRSLATRLSATLALMTLVAAAVAGAWSYRSAYASAKSLQDDTLVQVAALAVTAAASGSSVLSTDGVPVTDADVDIDLLSLADAGLASDAPAGLSTSTIDGTPHRVAVARAGDGTAVAAVQPVASRSSLARESAIAATAPILALIPLLALGLILATRRAFAPVRRLAEEVAANESHTPAVLDAAAAPLELRGFVEAINDQNERLVRAAAAERVFIMQAAHELRVPLTAVQLQVERAAMANDPDALRARLTELAVGVQRSRHVVEQLLALAHAQAAPREEAALAPFSQVLRGSLTEVLPVADGAGVELEVAEGADLAVEVPVQALTAALRNALDNAVRHGGDGGRVVVTARLAPGSLEVAVEDGGPGIEDPENALRPFARGARAEATGSGLGLAIIAEQMARVGGSVAIHPATMFPTGTRIVLKLPLEYRDRDS